jgi:hypothetical protein
MNIAIFKINHLRKVQWYERMMSEFGKVMKLSYTPKVEAGGGSR